MLYFILCLSILFIALFCHIYVVKLSIFGCNCNTFLKLFYFLYNHNKYFLQVHFKNQSQHLLKILKILAQFRQQCSITSSEVLNILQPMLKNQSHLLEELIALLPDLAPSEKYIFLYLWSAYLCVYILLFWFTYLASSSKLFYYYF